MADADDDAREPAVRQPLPPEVPAPAPHPDPGPPAPEAGEEEAGREWWRAPTAPPDAGTPGVPPPPEEPPHAAPTAPPGPDAGTGAGPDWWQGGQVRGELRDAWATQGQDGVAAAHEIGAHIGEAISSRLPDPHAAAAQRGLDIRWMRLKYNLPAIFLALMVTWGGKSATDRMVDSVAAGGIFAPLGWVLIFGLLLLAVMFLPIGGILGAVFSNLVGWLTRAGVAFVGWGWHKPYIGYVLRLVLAVAVWAFIFAVAAQVWRGAVHLLTGA
ncbi:hypothetical protein [Streptomyces spirodelae]|uniref:Uncharacterized protein n=1 Tax=Streptomyces spirodelae TaxID=2812904 RepID=A0ABS3X1D9_9ACTN|nr:hypothetical protein [Streptomyces spirodelae]MBO8189193.1 hypothetical protein [Streptomyces spirodelae]